MCCWNQGAREELHSSPCFLFWWLSILPNYHCLYLSSSWCWLICLLVVFAFCDLFFFPKAVFLFLHSRGWYCKKVIQFLGGQSSAHNLLRWSGRKYLVSSRARWIILCLPQTLSFWLYKIYLLELHELNFIKQVFYCICGYFEWVSNWSPFPGFFGNCVFNSFSRIR